MTAPRPRLPPGAEEPPGHVFLQPGAVYCEPEPALVTTILGSCVAICLWDRVRHIGGMNHYVLPYDHGSRSTRYGDVAIERLRQAMIALGCEERHLRAKLFGGATVLPFSTIEDTVGARNQQVAFEQLRAYGIPVVARRLGGATGMLIRMETGSGHVMVRRLHPEGRPLG